MPGLLLTRGGGGMYFVRKARTTRYYYQRGKDKGFQDGNKGAKNFRTWETAERKCIEIQERTGIACEYIDEFEIERESL